MFARPALGSRSLASDTVFQLSVYDSIEGSLNSNATRRTRVYENLHTVLVRLIQIVRQELESLVPKYSSSVLTAPKKRPGQKNFWPDSLYLEFAEYYNARLSKPDQKRQTHKHMGHYRLSGDVQYCFDRSLKRNRQNNGITIGEGMFEPDPNAGKSLHAHVEWRSILSKHDKHGTNGRGEADKIKKLEKAFRAQGAWVHKQQAGMADRRQVCAHLLALFEEEIEKEERREILLLEGKGRRARENQVKVYRQRSEAADRIIRVLNEYHLLGHVEHADYLIYSLNIIRGGLGLETTGYKSATDSVGGASGSVSATTLPSTQDSTDFQQSPFELPIPRPKKYRPKLRRQGSGASSLDSPGTATITTKTTRKHFENAGLTGNIRRAVENDSTAKSPCIMPLPKAYQLAPTHGVEMAAMRRTEPKPTRTRRRPGHASSPASSPEKRPGAVRAPPQSVARTRLRQRRMHAEKEDDARSISHRADEIFNKLALEGRDPVTGKRTDRDVPLFTRMTGKIAKEDQHAEGRMWYSPVFGRPLTKFAADHDMAVINDKSSRTVASTLDNQSQAGFTVTTRRTR
mmetsp:Transcript_5684/g.15932  ORF Transcript_5684/g.15932 Transcript_5684/m.15932 type:complete len:572 (-) Transcript_5684:1176-2891(-)